MYCIDFHTYLNLFLPRPSFSPIIFITPSNKSPSLSLLVSSHTPILPVLTACDTWASLKQPPPETIIFNMVIVLFVQGFANSASRHAVVLGWMISIITTNVSLHLMNSDAYFWINVEYLLLLCVSYEFERHTLRHFIKVNGMWLPLNCSRCCVVLWCCIVVV